MAFVSFSPFFPSRTEAGYGVAIFFLPPIDFKTNHYALQRAVLLPTAMNHLFLKWLLNQELCR